MRPTTLLPQLHADLTTHSVLAMSVVGGVPVESLVDAPQEERDRVMTLLFALLLRELFEFRLVQTDPNFANYRYDTETGQLILLDFGATRPYKATMANEFRRLMKGAITGDRDMMDAAAMAIGYYDATTQDRHRQTILDMGELAIEPFTREGPYDFGTSDVLPRLRARGIELGLDRDFWQIPPGRRHAAAAQVRRPVPAGDPAAGAGGPARAGADRTGFTQAQRPRGGLIPAPARPDDAGKQANTPDLIADNDRKTLEMRRKIFKSVCKRQQRTRETCFFGWRVPASRDSREIWSSWISLHVRSMARNLLAGRHQETRPRSPLKVGQAQFW